MSNKTDRFMLATGIVLGCLDSDEVRKDLDSMGIDVNKIETSLRDVYLATLSSENNNTHGSNYIGELLKEG